MRPLSIAAATDLEASPLELAAAAAAAGFDALGVRLPDDGAPPDLAQTRRRIESLGLYVLDLEIFRLFPDTNPLAAEPLLEAAAQLGAGYLLTVGEDAEEERLADKLAALAVLASGYGVRPVLEFMPFTQVRTLKQALRVLSSAADSRLGLLVDILHLMRSGGSVDDMAAVDRSLLHYAHVCDATAAGPSGVEDLRHEARFARLLPGLGALPLPAFIDALPPELPLAIEVPGAVGGTVDEKAAAAGKALRAVLERQTGSQSSV